MYCKNHIIKHLSKVASHSYFDSKGFRRYNYIIKNIYLDVCFHLNLISRYLICSNYRSCLDSKDFLVCLYLDTYIFSSKFTFTLSYMF